MTNRIISSSSQAANQLHAYLKFLDHEELWALYLTSDNRLITPRDAAERTADLNYH